MKKRLKMLIGVTLLVSISALFAFVESIDGQIKGWFLAGSAPKSYTIGVEQDAIRGGKVGFIKSSEVKIKDNGFGTIMQQFTPNSYLGKKVRLSGYIKSKEVKDWAGMWMRVDGEKAKTLSFDNMQDRPIKGTTDWTKCEIILEVPEKSVLVAYGVLLSGTGNVWLDDLKFDIVEKAKSETGRQVTLDEPANTSFEDAN